MIKIIGALLLAAAPTASQAPTAADVVAICRLAFVESLSGSAPVKAKAIFDTLPEQAKPMAAALCASYRQGQLDLLAVQGGDPTKARAI